MPTPATRQSCFGTKAPAKVDAAGGGIAAATAAAYLPGVGSGKARRSGGDRAAAVSARR